MKDYISQDHCVYQNPFSLKMDFLSANQIRHGMEARLEKNLSTLCFKDWQLVMDINLRRFPNFIAGFWHMNSWLGKFHWCESLSVFWNLTITSAADISGEVHSKIFMENFIKRFLRKRLSKLWHLNRLSLIANQDLLHCCPIKQNNKQF